VKKITRSIAGFRFISEKRSCAFRAWIISGSLGFFLSQVLFQLGVKTLMNAHLIEVDDQKLQRRVFLGCPVGKQILLTTESELMHSNSSQVPDLGLSDDRSLADDLHLIFNCQLQGAV